MLEIYCDGAVEPVNPGGVGAVGLCVLSGDEEIYAEGHVVGEGPGITNNKMEYLAVSSALEWVEKQGSANEEILLCTDSQLVVHQLAGRWRTDPTKAYYSAYATTIALLPGFPALRLRWIPREHNSRADALAAAAYRSHIAQHQDCVARRFPAWATARAGSFLSIAVSKKREEH
jgi:ribonuclease HI